jgi:hypothetical protein
MKKAHIVIALVCVTDLFRGFFLVSAAPVEASSDREKIAVYGLRSGTYLTQSSYDHQANIIQQRWQKPPKERIRLPNILVYAALPFCFGIFLSLLIHFLVTLDSEQRIRKIQKPWVAFD